MGNFQLQNRREIRRAIGYALNSMALITATTNGDTTSLISNYGFAEGGNDEYNGRQVVMITPAGSIVAGEKSYISDFDPATFDASLAPAFTSSTITGDIFELWKVFTYEEINEAINQAIAEVTTKALISRVTTNNFTQESVYLYDWLIPYAFGNDFRIVTQVEYVSSVGTEKTIHTCDAVWDELVDADVTASLDTSFKKQGGGSLKLVVAAGCGAGDILATEDITSLDLSLCTEVQIWIYSTVALDDGDLQLLLDNTAKCASPVESMDIPATTANTWTRHVITLANPQSDSAIISVGLKMVVDKGAFSLWVDDIKAINALSNQYEVLPIEYWSISQGATPYLQITSAGLSLIGSNTQVRLTGFSSPDIFSDDTTNSEVDPAYLVAKVTGRLLISHAKSSYLDIHDRAKLATYWLGEAARMEVRLTPSMPGTARLVKA